MNTDILITDDRLGLTLSLADCLRVRGCRVCLTTNTTTTGKKKEHTIGPLLSWNRSSLFSLQSIPLQLQNAGIVLEKAVIIFDAPAYTGIYSKKEITSTDTIITELITANIYLANIIVRYFLKKATGKLIFVYKDTPSAKTHTAIAAASGAFIRIAEDIITQLSTDPHIKVQTLPIRMDGEETPASIEWLASQIESNNTPRSSGRWIKVGQRNLFGK